MKETEKEEGTENILFFHGETMENGPKDHRFTVAGTVAPKQINLAIAICSKNDQFVKSEGRKLATERLIKDDNGIIVILADIKKGTERKTFNRFVSNLQWMSKNELIDLFNLRKEVEVEQ